MKLLSQIKDLQKTLSTRCFMKEYSKKQILTFFIFLFISIKILFLFLYAQNVLIVMDEFQQAGFAFYRKFGFYEKIFLFKTVLSAYFYSFAHLVGRNSIKIVLIARTQTVILALLSLILVFFISRNCGKGWLESLFVICFILAFTTFMERIFRVRSEPLALFFAILSLWLITFYQQTKIKIFLAGVLMGAAFLTTQKAIYFNVALGVALLINEITVRSYRPAIKAAFIFIGGWAFSVICYSFYFKGTAFYEVIEKIFSNPVNLALHGGGLYEGFSNFIIQTLIRNIIFYTVGIIGWIMAGLSFKSMSESERIFWIFSGLISVFVFNHNQPWPYIFIWAIPFISFWCLILFEWIREKRGQEAQINYMLFMLIILSVSFGRNIQYFKLSNKPQREVLRQAESLLEVSDTYHDGIGMIQNRLQAYRSWWDAPRIRYIKKAAAEGNYTEIEKIFSNQPKILIWTYRMEKLKDVLEPFLRNSYVAIFPNILISGASINNIFINRWEGNYRLYDIHGEKLDVPFLFDGQEITGKIWVSLGTHKLELKSPTKTIYLLPAGIGINFQIESDFKPKDLFTGVYK